MCHVTSEALIQVPRVLFKSEFRVIAPLDVFRLDSNDVGVLVSTVDSLLEAFKVIRLEGCGEYLFYSQKSGRRRFYKLTEDGEIAFLEREEVTTAGR